MSTASQFAFSTVFVLLCLILLALWSIKTTLTELENSIAGTNARLDNAIQHNADAIAASTKATNEVVSKLEQVVYEIKSLHNPINGISTSVLYSSPSPCLYGKPQQGD